MSKKQRLFVLWGVVFVVVLSGSSVISALVFSQAAPVPAQHAVSSATFNPMVGDIHDPETNDPDITVEQPLVPAFQFKSGGYELGGTVVDAQTKAPVAGAIVWINLPVQIGRPTSIALHTVADVDGRYQFLHIAAGRYTVVASRYSTSDEGRYYTERIFSGIDLNGSRSGLVLPLVASAAPGKRTVQAGEAKNLIWIDLRGFYADSLFHDPLLLNQTQNIRAFLGRAAVAHSVWLPYGWRPLDQYALFTGTYPQWSTYDPWPRLVPWGEPDSIDTTFWFSGGRSAHLFGQESIFDVAKGYGMQTSVIAGNDYSMSDATTRSLDLLQRTSTFAEDRWLERMEGAVLSGQDQASGYLIYGELAPLLASDGSSSPDAQGDSYQQALLRADQTFGRFLRWLAQEGYGQNTLIAFTTSQAQANHTDADNFYGMGSVGQGTSKQTLFALAGPGICPGAVNDRDASGFLITPTLMHVIGLPAPAEARFSSQSLVGGCT